MTSASQPQQDALVESHVWLRSHLNKILRLLYGTNKAYAQPDELSDLVRLLSGDLDRWYKDQPLDQHFVRDATIFNMHAPEMSFRVVRPSSSLLLLDPEC